jgi:hypothetical protein
MLSVSLGKKSAMWTKHLRQSIETLILPTTPTQGLAPQQASPVQSKETLSLRTNRMPSQLRRTTLKIKRQMMI